MFEKLKKIFKNREEKEKHNYDLTFDNVAIPEVHVKKLKVTRTQIKKMHLSAMTMLPYLRCISETEKINKLKLHIPFALSQSTYPSLLIVLILPSQQILSFPQTDPPLK